MYDNVSEITYQHKIGVHTSYCRYWTSKGMRSANISFYKDRGSVIIVKASSEKLKEMKEWCKANDIRGGIYCRPDTDDTVCVLTSKINYMAFMLRWG